MKTTLSRAVVLDALLIAVSKGKPKDATSCTPMMAYSMAVKTDSVSAKPTSSQLAFLEAEIPATTQLPSCFSAAPRRNAREGTSIGRRMRRALTSSNTRNCVAVESVNIAILATSMGALGGVSRTTRLSVHNSRASPITGR